MNNDHEDKALQAYCHYPLKWAEQEHMDSQNDMYRIVTINWSVASSEHVHKNIYEMTLGEFLLWWWDMEEVAEVVINIEKIDD